MDSIGKKANDVKKVLLSKKYGDTIRLDKGLVKRAYVKNGMPVTQVSNDEMVKVNLRYYETNGSKGIYDDFTELSTLINEISKNGYTDKEQKLSDKVSVIVDKITARKDFNVRDVYFIKEYFGKYYSKKVSSKTVKYLADKAIGNKLRGEDLRSYILAQPEKFQEALMEKLTKYLED
jgi:hypothetical protein